MEGPVLVTGAAGFIGQSLVRALRERSYDVRALVRRDEHARALRAPGVEVMTGDLLDPQTAARASDGMRSVFHLAGRLFNPGDRRSLYERVHVDATMALLAACAAAPQFDVFLLCSTTGVHGPTGAVPAAEDDPGHPQNAYEVTKAEAERRSTELARRLGVRLVIARPGLVYGPGDRHLLGWFRAIQRGWYRVLGRGDNALHPIYIDDLVNALLLCASCPVPIGRAYHLVGSDPVAMRELSEAIARAVGRRLPRASLPVPLAFAAGAALELLPVSRRRLPLTRSRVRFMLQNRVYDGSRARQELGFVPAVGLDDGLRKTVAWYRAHGLL